MPCGNPDIYVYQRHYTASRLFLNVCLIIVVIRSFKTELCLIAQLCKWQTHVLLNTFRKFVDPHSLRTISNPPGVACTKYIFRWAVAIRLQVSGLPGITFHPQGLTSQAKLQDDGRDFTTITENFTTIERSMIDLGVRWLDVLKMDIEGEEWVVMLEMLESGIDMPFTQILIGELACARSDLYMLRVTAPSFASDECWSDGTSRLPLSPTCRIPIHSTIRSILKPFRLACELHACICANSITIHNPALRSRDANIVELPARHGSAEPCNARAHIGDTAFHA